MDLTASLARRIVSLYPGVPVAQVAAAEGCLERHVRRARIQAKRKPELGVLHLDSEKREAIGSVSRRALPGEQLNFYDALMRSNTSVCG